MITNVLDYLEQTAERLPEKAAFCDEEEAISFRDLLCKARSIGTTLSADGFNHDPIVVLMQRQARAVTAFLGAVYAACYYVPLDAELSQRRIGDILSNLTHSAVIADDCAMPLLQSLGYAGRVYRYDDLIAAPSSPEKLRQVRAHHVDTDPLYVVYTSGSTGKPKGVVASHRSVIDYIEHLSQVLGFSEQTVFGNQAPLYFDACLKELYPTLKFGATTYIIPKKLFMFPVQLMDYLNRHHINTICWVGSALTMVASMNTFRTMTPKYLHTVAFAGEEVPIAQLNRWRAVLPEARFFNLYGPTETTGICCYYQVERDFSPHDRLPIGRPLPNTEILLLDEHDRLASPGEVGEICIRGAGLTLGYYGVPELTAKAFVQTPLHSLYEDKLYRTGDLGRFNERGELMFLSRRDNQIKHMGHRIELGDIEAAAAQANGVELCSCLYDAGSRKLILYYTGAIGVPALAAHLKGSLPRYMLPQSYRQLNGMPRTETGKIDRKALMQGLHEEKEKHHERTDCDS